jgi:hypothetical protein
MVSSALRLMFGLSMRVQSSSISKCRSGDADTTSGHAADSLIGSRIEESLFSGMTRVEIGHIRIDSAGYGRIKSCGSGSSLSQRS